MKLDVTTWKRWVDWSERIEESLSNTLGFKAIHDCFAEVVMENAEHIDKHHGGTFYDLVRYGYGVQAAMAVRRQVKNDKGSVSLARLLDQINKCSEQFTYEFYLERFPLKGERTFPGWQEDTFNGFSEDGKIISRDVIARDQKEIETLNTEIGAYVDRVLAHDDIKGRELGTTYKKIDDALAVVDRIACRYIALLTSNGYATLMAQNDYPWQGIFKVPFDIRDEM